MVSGIWSYNITPDQDFIASYVLQAHGEDGSPKQVTAMACYQHIVVCNQMYSLNIHLFQITAGDDDYIRTWDTNIGQMVTETESSHSRSITCIATCEDRYHYQHYHQCA